jgi:hypothetical protein
MNTREKNILDAFINMREFDAQNAADYAAFPDAEANFAIIRSVIVALESHAAKQTSGVSGQAVEQKSSLAAAIRRKMKEIARNARALNINDEGFRRLFSVPESNSDQKLLAAAREFVTQAAIYKAEFLRLAMPPSFIDDLQDDIDDFAAALKQKASGQSATVGATAGIDTEIERGMNAATIVDAIMQNVYRNNPVKLAAWTQARHIKRSPQRKPKQTQPPQP